MEAKRKVPSLLSKILDYDVTLTKDLVDWLLKYPTFNSLKVHGTFLDLSCNGAVWFPMWIAFIWLLSKQSLYEMQTNVLIGLIIDIIFIALLKAFIRRRRPTPETGILNIGPDKFSFPSGHTSRAFFLLFFFTILWPLPIIFWLPITAWACCVALSRLLIRRHYILDVCAGILLSLIEICIVAVFWIGSDTALNMIEFLTSDNLADGGLDDL